MSNQIIIMTTSREIKFEPLETADVLAQLQRSVGGLVECVNLRDGLDAWCNEEGLLEGLPPNDLASALLARFIVGDVVIAGHDDEGETTPAPDDIIAMFEHLQKCG